jgi:hypothetical protein
VGTNSKLPKIFDKPVTTDKHDYKVSFSSPPFTFTESRCASKLIESISVESSWTGSMCFWSC